MHRQYSEFGSVARNGDVIRRSSSLYFSLRLQRIFPYPPLVRGKILPVPYLMSPYVVLDLGRAPTWLAASQVTESAFDMRWSPTHRRCWHSWTNWCLCVDEYMQATPHDRGSELAWRVLGHRMVTMLTGSAEEQSRSAVTDGAVCATLRLQEDEVYGLEMLSSEGLPAVGAGDEVQHWDPHRATRSCILHSPPRNGVICVSAPQPGGKAYVLSFPHAGAPARPSQMGRCGCWTADAARDRVAR